MRGVATIVDGVFILTFLHLNFKVVFAGCVLCLHGVRGCGGGWGENRITRYELENRATS